MDTVPNQQGIVYIPVEKLEFDPKNPRLPKNLLGKNESYVLAWMLTDATLVELMASIAEQGFFAGEPLLAIPDKNNRDKYIVIEGNRRLGAVKLLNDPRKAEAKQISVTKVVDEARFPPPAALPTLIYKTREDILDYLGYRHITGIKAWEPLAKAQYLKQLAEKLDEPDHDQQFKQLAKIIGSRAPYVAELLTGLALYETMEENDFFDIKGLDETQIDFSLITTALHYSDIAKFLGLENGRDVALSSIDLENLKDLMVWMFSRPGGSTRLGESRNLRKLNAVVAHPEALRQFRNSSISLDDAALLTNLPIEIFRQSIQDARLKLELARNYLHRVDEPTYMDVEELENLRRLIELLYSSVSNTVKGKAN